MEVTAPNTLKLRTNEHIYELIRLIKPDTNHKCRFLEGPLWIREEGIYAKKLVSRTYHLINHHVYVVRKNVNAKGIKTYLLVSGRGNINEITREKACVIVKKRKKYVDDYTLEPPMSIEDETLPDQFGDRDW